MQLIGEQMARASSVLIPSRTVTAARGRMYCFGPTPSSLRTARMIGVSLYSLVHWGRPIPFEPSGLIVYQGTAANRRPVMLRRARKVAEVLRASSTPTATNVVELPPRRDAT